MRGFAYGLIVALALVVSAGAQGWPPKNGSSLPATCAVGEGYFLTNDTNTQFYECTVLNTWTHVLPGVGGSSAWGDITGTLSNQTDLQTALDGKEPAGVAFSELTGSATDAQVPNTITVDLATTATTANAGDTATAFFSAGTIETARLGSGTADATTFLRGDQTWATPAGGSGPTVVRVTADVSDSTSADWQDVTGLTKAVTSGTTYAFACFLTYTTAATTTALQLSVNGPAVTALDYGVDISTTATAKHNSAQTAYDTVVNPATGGGTTRLPATIHGTVIPSANGTLAVRMRTEVNSSAATVKRGSWCEVHTL